jgi:hypothetical protein
MLNSQQQVAALHISPCVMLTGMAGLCSHVTALQHLSESRAATAGCLQAVQLALAVKHQSQLGTVSHPCTLPPRTQQHRHSPVMSTRGTVWGGAHAQLVLVYNRDCMRFAVRCGTCEPCCSLLVYVSINALIDAMMTTAGCTHEQWSWSIWTVLLHTAILLV